MVLKFKNVGERESCFPDCWKVSLVVLKFKNVGESSTAKNYLPVSLFSLVSKVLQKVVIGFSITYRNLPSF